MNLRQTIEYMPDWAYGYDVAQVNMIRAGVYYTGLELRHIVPFLEDAEPLSAYAAIGPAIFWHRVRKAPYVAYDAKLADQNEKTFVCNRAWPWCYGDDVWALARWQGNFLIVVMRKDTDCDLYMQLSTSGRSAHDMAEAMKALAVDAAGSYLRAMPADIIDPTRRSAQR